MKKPLLLTALVAIISTLTIVYTLAPLRQKKAHLSSTQSLESGPSERTGEDFNNRVLEGIEPLAQQSTKYFGSLAGLENASECIPVLIENQQDYDLAFLHCSDEVLKSDGEARPLTKTFTVTEGLARKYNFWRRIYSQFTSKQQLMHLATHPEVVLEIYDLSNRPTLSYHDQRKLVSAISKERQSHYQRLFQKLHKYRSRPVDTLSADMRRVVRLMAHIPDDNKYLIAANSMRTQTGQRDFVAAGVRQASRYINEIEHEFERQGVPRELAKLAFVESSFNLNARSRVGASGVFQIMQETGRQYLRIEDGIDERNDPIKAARAAAKLLRMNYRITQAWPLAITAYNHGIGSIKRAVVATGTRDIEVIIDQYDHENFGFASKNFYSEYLAMLGTLADSEELFPVGDLPSFRSYGTHRMHAPTPIDKIRKKFRVTNEQIAEFNPDISRQHLRRNGLLPKGYILKIPVAAPAVSAIYSKAKPTI